MKSQLMLLSVATALSLGAADITINEPTNFTGTVSVNNLYANANVTVGGDASGELKIAASSYVYLPGSAGKSSTFKIQWGKTTPSGNASGFKIGNYEGYGYINVDDCGSDVTLGRVEVYDGATASQSGYVDFLRCSNGKEANGHWHRIYQVKYLNYRSANKPMARILFNGKGGALSPNSNSDGNYFYISGAGTKTVLEGQGGVDVVFLNGSWWTSPKTMYMLQESSQGILRTQGDCKVVFHNHNAGSGAMPDYKFVLNKSTNNFEWAHSGSTIISNACMLVTTADYALPNGPQTGTIDFTGVNWTATPVLDLAGTTQIVNGMRHRHGSNSGQYRSFITNSSEKAATLITGAMNQDCEIGVGNITPGVTVKKVGTGTLRLNVYQKADDLLVTDGVMLIALSTTADAVSVTGGELVVSNATLTCSSLSTSGDGVVRLVAGGKISCPDMGDVRYVVDASSGEQMTFSPDQFDLDSVSLVKTGVKTLTFACNTRTIGEVAVKEGTLRVGGALAPYEYWRFVCTSADYRPDFSFETTDDRTDMETSGQRRTVHPVFALNRFHLINGNGAMVNSGVAYQAKNLEATDLDVARSTANRVYLWATGVNSSGGVFTNPGILVGGFSNWFSGLIFALEDGNNPASELEPITYTFRMPANRGAPIGYWMSECVNVSMSKPKNWTIQASNDGTTWTTLDTRTDAASLVDKKREEYGVPPILFKDTKSTWRFKPTGVVKVASGATLDTTEIDDANVSIAKLEADVAVGAGAITKFVPAANGEIRLVNVTGELGRWTELYDVGSVVGADNLKGWTVYVNGSLAKGFDARVRNGKLCVHKIDGLFVVVR